jgi:small subunit ribosomal protein S9
MTTKKTTKPKENLKKYSKKTASEEVKVNTEENTFNSKSVLESEGETLFLNSKTQNKPEELSDKIKDYVYDKETTKIGSNEKYYEAVGRRKESVARVRLYTRKSNDIVSEEKAIIQINGKDYREYFNDISLWSKVELPLKKLKSMNRFKATVLVRGGGKSGQADAVKHGLARALIKFDSNFRKKLKKAGYLTRDPREKERRKYGLKKARKSPRWAKR